MAVRFEVEGVLRTDKHGTYVLARCLEPSADFCLTIGSTLGGIPLKKYLEVPRATDGDGKQREDVFSFALADGEQGSALNSGAVVELWPGEALPYLLPWHPTDAELSKQLSREISALHPLFGVSVHTLARRQDNDDVLFELCGDRKGFAVVHLTWASKPLHSMDLPTTKFYEHWWEVFEDAILPANKDWK